MSYDIALLLLINPLAQAIQDARYFVISSDVESVHTLTSNPLIIGAPFVIAAVMLVIGATYFRMRSPYFAEDI